MGHRDFDVEKKLRRDLKRTHALLADAQLLLSTVDNHGQNLPNGSREQIERLHCQVVITHSYVHSPDSQLAVHIIHSLCRQLAGGERSEAAGGGERSGNSLPGAGEHSD